ncbi:Ni,Fe-hydrogenase I large subunit [Novosphingobium sp. SG707]|uniref:Ni,Fe-hydrogenase I large subunit n=1 Tax=Novosphingobium sp. SG707 TaxID=2586996 RepID=UPI001446C2C7|nr:Ni,Fe-hydrogenase I large subunit [Novosphingobium sp. SG707]NKI99525.1 coenzyme F420-reducing hydrogenase alpha subunit [Novosphingobium sp. SG707]
MTGPAIRIAITPGGGRIAHCAIPNAQGLLIGLPAIKVGQALRRLHGICREAQGLAGELAVAAAMGEAIAQEELDRRIARVHAEARRETGLRLCLDWAVLIGERPQTELARAVIAGDWSVVEASGLAERFLARAPEALRPIFAARLAGAPVAPDMHAPEPGMGVAGLTCARGRLTHRAALHKGRVAAYTMDAPTARRFGPDGDAAALLAQCHGAKEAAWVMQAIDPCVEWAMDTAMEAA